MKRICLRIMAVILTAAMLCALPFRLKEVHAAVQPPEISAKACALVDAQTGLLVYGSHEQEKRPMASTTKIMTVLLTLESGNLDDPFVVDSDAIHVEGSSMGLQEGDVVTKRALCVGMLLPSGNDAANAAAVAVGGDIPTFLRMMNARAAKIGMTHTQFASPSGLDADGHGASAYDMALLAREALKNPDFAEICSQPSMSVSFGNPPYQRTLYNTNKLLKMDDTVIGVKTGFTDAAGRCLVSACERDGKRLICVTLYDRNDWNDHLALYDYGFAGAEEISVPLPQTLTLPIEGNAQKTAISVYAREPLKLTAWYGIAPQTEQTVLLPPFRMTPLQKGETVGLLRYTVAERVVAELPLLAAEECSAEKLA